MTAPLDIAVLGTGAIGSAMAFKLAKAGHRVTCIARTTRLAQLQASQAIELIGGDRAPVEVAGELDVTRPYDLVLVSVLATQVAPLLPALRASAANQVMFFFNTFESIEPLREAVGGPRFVFGFPGGVSAHLIDGKLKLSLLPGTTVGDARWARVFTEIGIKTATEPDMQSYLRSHAAFVIPMMSIGVQILRTGRGITWPEARAHATAMQQTFAIVRSLGHPLIPSMVGLIAALPRFMLTFTMWSLSRTQLIRNLGMLGPTEARMLTAQIAAIAPEETALLLSLSPRGEGRGEGHSVVRSM